MRQLMICSFVGLFLLFTVGCGGERLAPPADDDGIIEGVPDPTP